MTKEMLDLNKKHFSGFVLTRSAKVVSSKVFLESNSMSTAGLASLSTVVDICICKL